MQPQTTKTKDLTNILQRIQKQSIIRQGLKQNSSFCTSMPQIVGLKLTNRCNLRCKTCYEWNGDGYHQNFTEIQQNQELNFDIIKKILEEISPDLYLWGGEPLIYHSFSSLSELIKNYKKNVAICTNGIFIGQKIDDLIKIGRNLELLIALDGVQNANDSIRGFGTYQKVVKNISDLLSLRTRGDFEGKLSIHTVLTERNISSISVFLNDLEHLGVDTVILCYPWYISEETSMRMTSFFHDILKKESLSHYSWNSFKFKYPEECLPMLLATRRDILTKKWRMNIRFQPDLPEYEINEFIANTGKLMNYACYALANRLDVLPDGSVTSCKHFPEFVLGNLKVSTLQEIWHSSEYTTMREIINQQIMPICSVCNNLYLHARKKN